MKFGVVFPQTEVKPDPAIIKDYAQTVEGLGYDYLLVYDHVLGANPARPGWESRYYNYKDSFNEPFVLFGYLAGLTRRLELVTGILILPQRQTVLAAKQAAQVDVLSGGRLRLGVGLGWNYVEYEALGENFHDRGKRCEEQIVLLNELWTNPLVTFRGKYHAVSDAGLNPLPVQRPIPLWFGGTADDALERMARLGQGWFPLGSVNDRLKGMVERLHRYLEAAGRKPETFGLDGHVSIGALPRAEWAGEVEKWGQVGATHVCVTTMRAGFVSPQEHLEAIRQFQAEMGLHP